MKTATQTASAIETFTRKIAAVDIDIAARFRHAVRNYGGLRACEQLVCSLYDLPATAWHWDEEQVAAIMGAANDLGDAFAGL